MRYRVAMTSTVEARITVEVADDLGAEEAREAAARGPAPPRSADPGGEMTERQAMPMTQVQRDQVTTGYQDTSTGRRCAPRAPWSDAAMRYALGLDRWLASPTAAQRAIGIVGFDQHGRSIFNG